MAGGSREAPRAALVERNRTLARQLAFRQVAFGLIRKFQDVVPQERLARWLGAYHTLPYPNADAAPFLPGTATKAFAVVDGKPYNLDFTSAGANTLNGARDLIKATTELKDRVTAEVEPVASADDQGNKVDRFVLALAPKAGAAAVALLTRADDPATELLVNRRLALAVVPAVTAQDPGLPAARRVPARGGRRASGVGPVVPAGALRSGRASAPVAGRAVLLRAYPARRRPSRERGVCGHVGQPARISSTSRPNPSAPSTPCREARATPRCGWSVSGWRTTGGAWNPPRQLTRLNRSCAGRTKTPTPPTRPRPIRRLRLPASLPDPAVVYQLVLRSPGAVIQVLAEFRFNPDAAKELRLPGMGCIRSATSRPGSVPGPGAPR